MSEYLTDVLCSNVYLSPEAEAGKSYDDHPLIPRLLEKHGRFDT